MENKIWASYGMKALMMFFPVALLLLLRCPARAQDVSCLNQLSPCLNYLNGTTDPPDSCCDPLKDMIKSNPECLCNMISNQGAFTAQIMGINVTEAQELPGRCGEHVNPLVCLSGSPTTGSSDRSSAAASFWWPALIRTMAVAAVSLQIISVRILSE